MKWIVCVLLCLLNVGLANGRDIITTGKLVNLDGEFRLFFTDTDSYIVKLSDEQVEWAKSIKVPSEQSDKYIYMISATYNTGGILTNNTLMEVECTSTELEMVRLCNEFRARNGRKPLQILGTLMNTARAHINWMTRNGMQHGNYPVAENIACGQSSPADAMHSWINSTGHRNNMLGNRTHIGVGSAAGNGKIYWTQQFISK